MNDSSIALHVGVPARVDIAAGLPDGPVSRKYLALRSIADRADDLVRGLALRSEATRKSLGNARAQLAHLNEEVRSGSWRETRIVERRVDGRRVQRAGKDTSRRDALEAAIARHAEDLHTLEAEAAALIERHGGERKLVARVEAYIRQLGFETIAGAGQVKLPKGKAGGDRTDTLQAVRAEIAALHAQIAAASAAPFPSDMVKDAVARQVGSLAARGRPAVEHLFRDLGAGVDWPKAEQRLHTVISDGRTGFTHGRSPDPLALLAWLYRDDLIETLGAEIDAAADDTAALTPEQRRDRIVELKVKILAAERREEAVIVAAAEAGVALPRRGGADPRAVLSLGDDLPPPKE